MKSATTASIKLTLNSKLLYLQYHKGNVNMYSVPFHYTHIYTNKIIYIPSYNVTCLRSNLKRKYKYLKEC